MTYDSRHIVNRSDLCNWLISALAEQRRIDRALALGDTGHTHILNEKSVVAAPVADSATDSEIIILTRDDERRGRRQHNKVSTVHLVPRRSLLSFLKSRSFFPGDLLR